MSQQDRAAFFGARFRLRTFLFGGKNMKSVLRRFSAPKKKTIFLLILVFLSLSLSACFHEHKFSEWQIVVPASCEAEGIRERVCDCGETESVSISLTPHDFENATCNTPMHCKNCTYTEGLPLEHDWHEATCTAPKTCSLCGEVDGLPIDHSLQPATCVSPIICLISH